MSTSISTAVATIQEALAVWELPGVVIGITDRQHLQAVAVHGYADLKARVPLTEQGRFAIGSISKSFTALAVLQLADEGRQLLGYLIENLEGVSYASAIQRRIFDRLGMTSSAASHEADFVRSATV